MLLVGLLAFVKCGGDGFAGAQNGCLPFEAVTSENGTFPVFLECCFH